MSRLLTRARKIPPRSSDAPSAILAECQKAAAELDRLTRKLEQAHLNIEVAESDLQFGERVVGDVHRARPPADAYPSDLEVAKWQSILAEAEEKQETAAKRRREVVAAQDRVVRDIALAKQNVAALQFREWTLRRPTPAQRGQLWHGTI